MIFRPGACSPSPIDSTPSEWLSLSPAWRGRETIGLLRNIRNGTSWPPPCCSFKRILSFLTAASLSLGITPTQQSQAQAAFWWGEGWKGEKLMKEQDFAFPQSQSNSLVDDSTIFWNSGTSYFEVMPVKVLETGGTLLEAKEECSKLIPILLIYFHDQN